jgi:hypothetical protein
VRDPKKGRAEVVSDCRVMSETFLLGGEAVLDVNCFYSNFHWLQ